MMNFVVNAKCLFGAFFFEQFYTKHSFATFLLLEFGIKLYFLCF